MKIILLGPNGQLGQDIIRANEQKRTVDVVPLGRDALDLSDLERVRTVLGAMQFDALINSTGYHRTDEVESNAQLGVLMNGHLVRELASICSQKRARFMTLSTDYVFGGQDKRTPLTEADTPAPVNAYGATKLLGESLARAAYADSMVLRVSSLFGVAGSSGKGGNFVETMLRLAKEKGSLRVIGDQIMSPTATADIAEAILRLFETNAPAGIYHVAGAGQASWWEFAKRIVDRAGLSDVIVEKVTAAEFPTLAARPSYSVLACDKLASAIGWSMPPWQDALDRYLVAKGHRQS